MKTQSVLILTFIHCSFLAGPADWVPSSEAHTGRRFRIEVIDNQLEARGYISDNTDDGGGSIRPYANAVHDHWISSTGLATLPGFDILTPGPLETFDVSLSLLGVQKWAPPVFAPCTSMAFADCANVPTTPAVLQPLTGEDAFASVGDIIVRTDTIGAVALTTDIMSAGAADLDITYAIDSNPLNEIFVFEWRLSTNAPGVADSESVFAIISPDGIGPIERHHHASLFLEEQLSGFRVVPEPSGLSFVGLLLLVAAAFKKRHGQMRARS